MRGIKMRVEKMRQKMRGAKIRAEIMIAKKMRKK